VKHEINPFQGHCSHGVVSPCRSLDEGGCRRASGEPSHQSASTQRGGYQTCGATKSASAQRTGFASSVKYRLTRPLAFRFLSPNYGNQLQFTADMKKLFVLLMLISFAMICSCQITRLTAEQQLAQRKTELDARENALDEREKALAEREEPHDRPPILPALFSPNVQSPGQVRDAGQRKLTPRR